MPPARLTDRGRRRDVAMALREHSLSLIRLTPDRKYDCARFLPEGYGNRQDDARSAECELQSDVCFHRRSLLRRSLLRRNLLRRNLLRRIRGLADYGGMRSQAAAADLCVSFQRRRTSK